MDRRTTAAFVLLALAMSPDALFGFDRYALPKEWVLHLAALVGWAGSARVLVLGRVDRIDLAAWLFCLASATSAALAQNGWVALRALALSSSAVLLFRLARLRASQGSSSLLWLAAVLCGIVASALALLEAWGILPDWSTPHRAPSGTFGNRNAMAHVVALALPAASLLALRRTGFARGAGLALLTLGSAAVLLSRSRAAWLAIIAGAALACVWLAVARTGVWRARRPLLPGLLAVALGMALSQLPNRLHWSSATPIRDSLVSFLEPQRGSAEGRLAQAEVLVSMFREAPLWGTGPGNFRVHLARYSRSQIPVRLPNNDWLGLLAERGLVAGACVAALVVAMITAWRRRARSEETLLGVLTLLVLFVLGCFDAVITQAAPAMVSAVVMGACLQSAAEERSRWPMSAGLWISLMLVSALGLVRTSLQLWSGHVYSQAPLSRERYEEAARIDPGNDVLQRKLAEYWVGRGECARAEPYLEAYAAQMPHEYTLVALRTRCP